MAEVDFSDRDSATAWFEAQSPEMRCVMTSRAALRVVANLCRSEPRHKERLALTCFRAILTSAGRGVGRPADVARLELAARSALAAADSAAHSTFSAFSALSAAHCAARSTFSADSAARSALSAVHSASTHDAAFSASDLLRQAVWGSVAVADPIARNHDAFLAFLAAGDDWVFWHRWYSEMWAGTFTDWDLAIEVALIPDDTWEGEDALAKVAEAIRGIEARLITERLPQVEEIYETGDGLYEVKSVHTAPANLIDSIESRITFALDMAVKSNACDLNEMSVAAKMLRHALDICKNDPNALEQLMRQASALIKGRVADGTFAESDALEFLVGTLDELSLQLRADHPDVAAAADARSQQTVREMDEAKRLEGARLIADMRPGTGPRLTTEFGLASATVQDGGSPVATADALKQSGNRAGKISLAERAKKAEGSGAMSATKIALRAERLVEYVTGLLSGGGM